MKGELERRGFAGEIRVEGAGQAARLRGYAAVYDLEAEIWPGYFEVIKRGAFAKSIAGAGAKPIKALFNHDTGVVLGSTPKTLRLSEDDRGLRFEIELPATATVRDLVVEPIRRGDLSGVSFGFRAVDAPEMARPGGGLRRELREVELFEVSPVAFPAYAGTEMKLRAERRARDSLQRAQRRVMGETVERLASEIQAELDEIRTGAAGRAPTPYEERRIRSLEAELETAPTRHPPIERPDPTLGGLFPGAGAPAVHTREARPFSLIRFLVAQSSRDWSDAKVERRWHDRMIEAGYVVHDERSNLPPPFALLPLKRQLEIERRDVDSSGAGSLIAVDLGVDAFIELLRNEALVLAAGARVLPGLVGTLDIPRQSAGASGGWIATETGSPSESQLTTDKLTLAPKTFGMRTEITRKMLKQATPSAEELVREDLRRGIGIAIDSAAINGSGASGQPTGLLLVSGVGTVTHGGALTATWSNMLEYESDLGTANAPSARRAFFMRSAARAALKATAKAANVAAGFLMEMDGKSNGYPSFVTEQCPASGSAGAIIFGDWTELMIGLWGVLDLFSDPYTLGNSGGLVVRGFQDIDIAVRHATSFTKSAVF